MRGTLAEITEKAGESISMRFSYKLSGIGWADVELDINNNTYFFSPSYLTEALVDLVKSVEVLMPECVDEDEDEVQSSSTFTWNTEPAEYVWLLTRKDNQTLRLNIRCYEDGVGVGPSELLLDGECKFDEFVQQLVLSLEDILLKHGFVGYKQQWHSGEFPIGGYIMLKHYVTHNQKINIQAHFADDPREYLQTILEEELKLIKEVPKRL